MSIAEPVGAKKKKKKGDSSIFKFRHLTPDRIGLHSIPKELSNPAELPYHLSLLSLLSLPLGLGHLQQKGNRH